MSTEARAPEGGAFGRFEIRLAERSLRIEGRPVPLGSRAFDLLTALVARRDRVVSKDELMEVVWPGLVVEENNLQVQVSALRKVLGAQSIATVAGRGYQFTVAAAAPGMPATAQAEPARGMREADRSAVASGMGVAGSARPSRLLVADDNKVNRLLLCRSLQLMGHDVATADNGRAALELLRRERFDLLLLDLEMPEIDGFGLLEQRAAEPALQEVPVIVTSSLEGAAAVARCIELGADDYLHKPVNAVLLKARADSSLERKRLRDRQRELLARLAPGLHDGPQPAGAAPGGMRTEATLLVARLHDADALAAAQSPHEMLELLNDWFTLMLDAAEGRGGLVHRLGGDGFAAVFGAPEPARAGSRPPAEALLAAREMLELTAMFNAEGSASGSSQGKAALAAGIGIASGEIVAGYAGMPRRAAYVCIGAPVVRAEQFAARASAAAAGSTVLVDAATHAALSGLALVASLERSAVGTGAAAEPAYALKPA